MSHILKFENNSLRLYQANTGQLLMNQKHMPGIGNTDPQSWANSSQAFDFWNENLRHSYSHISNNEITIEE